MGNYQKFGQQLNEAMKVREARNAAKPEAASTQPSGGTDDSGPDPIRWVDDVLPIGGALGGIDDVDHHRNAPKPSPDCLYGLIGDIAIAGSENTEANPYAVAMSALAYLGVALGRGPYATIGDDWHHTNGFYLHVGRSARGRKGTAKKLMHRIAKRIQEVSEHDAPQVHRGGLSTREGLAFMIHDGYKDGKNEVPAIADKRLLIIESEFSNVLHQSKRDGNTLSPALRDAWDGVSIKPATKTQRMWASNPHIGMIGDVTPTELLDLMSSRELSNGFANRFLMIWAEGGRPNPFPKPTPDNVVNALADRIIEVLGFVQASIHVHRNTTRVSMSVDAAGLYANLYRGELSDRSIGDRAAGLLDRRAPMLLRLAMLFALTDKVDVIAKHHLEAGMAWIRYWTDSVKFIFQTAHDEVKAAKASDAASKILTYLAANGQAARNDLVRKCFKGHASKSLIDDALDDLLAGNPPQITMETVPREGGKTGTPTKIYKLAATCATSATCGGNTGFAGDSDGVRPVRPVRHVHQDDPLNFHMSPHVAHVASSENGPQTSMDTHMSHKSHISHGVCDDSEVF